MNELALLVYAYDILAAVKFLSAILAFFSFIGFFVLSVFTMSTPLPPSLSYLKKIKKWAFVGLIIFLPLGLFIPSSKVMNIYIGSVAVKKLAECKDEETIQRAQRILKKSLKTLEEDLDGGQTENEN